MKKLKQERNFKKEGYDLNVCYIFFLKKAIHTLNHNLDSLNRNWLPVVKA